MEALRALGRPARLLVAEDDPTNQFVIAKLLKDFDIRAHIAVNGLEALEAAMSTTPDLIFMDMQMPEMDGLQATRAIRKRGGRLKTVPIVALTANAYPEDMQACRDAGMDDFVVKPIKKDRLIGAILGALAHTKRIHGDAVSSPGSSGGLWTVPAFDESRYEVLVHELGSNTAGEMIAIFAAETRARLQRLAAPTLEPVSLLREVHTLAGSARTACATELANLAKAAETRLREKGGTAFPELPLLAIALTAYETALAARKPAASEAA